MIRRKIRIVWLFLALALVLASCGDVAVSGGTSPSGAETGAPTPELGDDNTSFGEALENTGMYDGYFESAESDLTVTWISGTTASYTLEGNTLTFTSIEEDTVYSVS
ncbi:MAG: hypothetical protein IJY12_01720, partial [Clostridia bacterium]|nr:hypothetical protein [Clostridia bacterium]